MRMHKREGLEQGCSVTMKPLLVRAESRGLGLEGGSRWRVEGGVKCVEGGCILGQARDPSNDRIFQERLRFPLLLTDAPGPKMLIGEERPHDARVGNLPSGIRNPLLDDGRGHDLALLLLRLLLLFIAAARCRVRICGMLRVLFLDRTLVR
jgi:hypothetical protein